MATSAQAGAQPSGLVGISRAVVSAAAELVGSLERAMIGEAKVRTARGNAWDAICEDRARARARDEMQQLVRALMASAPQAAADGHGPQSFAARVEAAESIPAHPAAGTPRRAEFAASSR
jgi:hypothetical protein